MSYNEEDGSYRKDNSNENYDSTQHQGVKTVTGNVKRVLTKISVEPYVILFAFSFGLYSIQIENLLIEKTCKVGSFFFGNGTTYNDEVLCDATTGLFIYTPSPFFLSYFHYQVCDNLFNGSFREEQRVVQEVAASVEMYSSLLKQVRFCIQ